MTSIDFHSLLEQLDWYLRTEQCCSSTVGCSDVKLSVFLGKELRRYCPEIIIIDAPDWL